MLSELAAWADQPFPSDAELISAMRSPRYSDPHDDAYRDAVAMKIALTEAVKEAAGISTEPARPRSTMTVDESGAVNVYHRPGKVEIRMSTGGEGPTLEEEAEAQAKRPVSPFTIQSGMFKPEQ